MAMAVNQSCKINLTIPAILGGFQTCQQDTNAPLGVLQSFAPLQTNLKLEQIRKKGFPGFPFLNMITRVLMHSMFLFRG